MSWKTDNSGNTVPEWWDHEYPWRESCVYLPRSVDLEGWGGGWLWLVKIKAEASGHFVYTITGLLGDLWVYPEESELVSQWNERCRQICEMYAATAKAAISDVAYFNPHPIVGLPPEDWFQNGPGLWPEVQIDNELGE